MSYTYRTQQNIAKLHMKFTQHKGQSKRLGNRQNIRFETIKCSI